MRTLSGSVLGLATAAIVCAPAVQAASFNPAIRAPANTIVAVQDSQQHSGRDCTPYNGPFGFYGNVWCQPPSEQSYLRNLSSHWPQKTPPSLKKPKPHDTGSDW